MKMNSMMANKLVKQLKERQSILKEQERDLSSYIVTDGEEPIVPDYNYEEVRDTIRDIENKIRTIKHAVNVANVLNTITYEDTTLTVDVALIKMAQLSERKQRIESLASAQAKRRIGTTYGGATEYKYANYDPAIAKIDYEKINNELTQLQLALDKYNLTYEFEVEI